MVNAVKSKIGENENRNLEFIMKKGRKKSDPF
jgi:hypothetical protein